MVLAEAELENVFALWPPFSTGKVAKASTDWPSSSSHLLEENWDCDD